MSKMTRILLALGLILAVATPALAEFKLNGYYRLMGYSAEVRSDANANVLTGSGAGLGLAQPNGQDEKGDSRQFVDQRLRLMATYDLNDNVGIVYFAEIDTVWGTAGGALGADNVNVETKNAYLNLKSGDTAAKLGVHAVNDGVYQGVMYNDDMAGLSVTHKIGSMTLNALYAKLWEDSRSYDDDTDLYTVGAKMKVSDNFTFGADVFYLDVNDAQNVYNSTAASYLPASLWYVQPGDTYPFASDRLDMEVWTVGLNAAAAFGNFKLDGFALYQDLALDLNNDPNHGSDSADGNSWLATVKGTLKLGNGDVGARFLYVSPNDDSDGVDQWVGNLGEYEFPGENLMQFMVDAFVCNYGKESYAWQDSVDQGYGLMAFMLSGNHNLPQAMYLKWGAGYFLAADDKADGATGLYGKRGSVGGDELGWEVAARIGKKFFEKVDVSLNASYADFGDFYDKTAITSRTGAGTNDSPYVWTGGDDPDATYKAYLMVNVPF